MNSEAKIRNPWLVPLSDQGLAIKPKVRLLGFPYAGGSASVYRFWPDYLGPEIEMLGLQLPGRGARRAEAPITDFNQLVQNVAEMMISQPSVIPTVFFGHSMGASLAFEVSCELASRGAPRPELLVVSGRAAPHLIPKDLRSRNWSDEEMVRNLRRMQGTPTELLDNPEVLELLMPTIRADYELLGSWRFKEKRWNGNMLALAGRQDAQVQVNDIKQWNQYTTGRFEILDYPGGHFFIHEQRKRVVSDVVMSIRRLVVGF